MSLFWTITWAVLTAKVIFDVYDIAANRIQIYLYHRNVDKKLQHLTDMIDEWDDWSDYDEPVKPARKKAAVKRK
jgi:hypothetical protein